MEVHAVALAQLGRAASTRPVSKAMTHPRKLPAGTSDDSDRTCPPLQLITAQRGHRVMELPGECVKVRVCAPGANVQEQTQ